MPAALTTTVYVLVSLPISLPFSLSPAFSLSQCNRAAMRTRGRRCRCVRACVRACIDALAPPSCRLLPLLLVSRIPRNCELIGKAGGTWNFLLSRLTESPNDRALRGKMVTCRDFISNAACDGKDETSIASTIFRFKIARLLPLGSSVKLATCFFDVCREISMISHKKSMSYRNKKKRIPD